MTACMIPNFCSFINMMQNYPANLFQFIPRWCVPENKFECARGMFEGWSEFLWFIRKVVKYVNAIPPAGDGF